MATAQKIHIDPSDTGLWTVKQTADSAKKASELLQEDLEVSSLFILHLHRGLLRRALTSG